MPLLLLVSSGNIAEYKPTAKFSNYLNLVQTFSIKLFLGVTRVCDLFNGKDVFGESQLDTYFICTFYFKKPV